MSIANIVFFYIEQTTLILKAALQTVFVLRVCITLSSKPSRKAKFNSKQVVTRDNSQDNQASQFA
jgi:hypothetical protein